MPEAIVCPQLGVPEILLLQAFASTPLREGEVRVEVHAAGLNFPDILMVAGDYQFKPELPFVPGMEAAGIIIEHRCDGAAFAAGDRVMVKMRHGAFAQEVVVTPDQIVRMPHNFDFADGATFLAAHGTAYHALVERAALQPGEVLLVHGAGGGVGLAAVELGKILGAVVIAVASHPDKLTAARDKGADHVVLTGSEPLRDAVKRITDGRGADVVFDPVGGAVFEESLRCVAWGARLLVIGFTGGVGNARTNLVLIKGLSVLGVRAGEAARRDPSLGQKRIAALLELADTGKIRPHISHRLPLEQCADAMRLLIDRKAIGRVALVME